MSHPDEPMGLLDGLPLLPRAACKGGGNLWDDRAPSPRGLQREITAERNARHAAAREVCRRCPEMLACLRARRDNPELPAGIWGGCYIGTGPASTDLSTAGDRS